MSPPNGQPTQVDTSAPLDIRHEGRHLDRGGPWLQRLMANTNFGDFESRSWFDKMLRQSGLYDRWEEMGTPGRGYRLSTTWNLNIRNKRRSRACCRPAPSMLQVPYLGKDYFMEFS